MTLLTVQEAAAPGHVGVHSSGESGLSHNVPINGGKSHCFRLARAKAPAGSISVLQGGLHALVFRQIFAPATTKTWI